LPQGEIGDVSQRGDWSSFRNSFYNKHRIFITPELFSSIPLQGHLTFDFSGSDFPPIHSHGGGGCVTISDIRLTNVLFNVAVINKIQKIHALHSLAMLEHETKRCILGDGSNTPPAIDTKIKSKGIRIAMNKFYLKLSLREKQMKKSLKNEEMKIGLKKGSMTSFAETDHEEKGEGDSDDDEEEESEDDDEKSRRSSKSSNKSDGDGSISGDDDDRDEAEKKKMRKKSEKSQSMQQQQIRKVSVVQEAVALTLTGVQPSRSSSNLNNYEINKSRKVQGNNGNGSRRSTSKPKGTSSSRIGFSTESKSEYTSNSSTTTGRLTRLPSTSAAAGTAATPTTTAAAVSRKPFNPKQLLPQKSSFAVDEKTGKTVRKLGNILTLSGSEKYLLEIGRKFINMSQLEKVSNHAKCIRIIQALEDILGRVWILSKHLAIIVGCFQLGLTNKTQTFGTYRVELIISLYCRVIDLYNFDLVLGVLTATEIGCLICRLGYLNIFNPLKPEGWYHLDFTIHEERMIGKLLGTLSFQEPGINFLYPRFRWEWSFEDIPGWSLLPTWIDETVFPHRGILSVQYYSGEGTNIHGCSPDPLFRRSLFPMVFTFLPSFLPPPSLLLLLLLTLSLPPSFPLLCIVLL
jgi:hypothetical protein